MRHAFHFPLHVRTAVKEYVGAAISAIEAKRFQQEPAYTTALAAKLEGIAYNGRDGFVKFAATIVNDRGPESAESWSGADLAITARISDSTTSIDKAILVQAKLDLVSGLSSREKDRLTKQVLDMRKLTRSPKIMECPLVDGVRQPAMISGTRLAASQPYRSMSFADYIVARVLTTLDGDTRPQFVTSVQDSSLVGLRVDAALSD